MPEGQVLEFSRITKRYGAVTAVADLSVRVEPGVVTGFLGPNGAGKTTSLRMLLGQIRPTSGTATIGGSSYSELRNPLRTVGAVLEEAAYRPRRTASRQLLIAAKGNGIPVSRVDEVLRLVGLQDDADTRLGSYSLGMRQRLAVASALLGDPGVLVLDEPANGLDPEGIRWMRLLMRRLADEGRTVLLSSHVLSEIEQVADNVVVLSKGRAVYSGGIEELADPAGGAVIVDAENRAQLITVLSAAKLNFDVLRSGVTVRDSNSATVGAITAAAGVPLTVLQQRGPSLEDVFLDLVYGRRADSPRLDQVANPVAHAPLSDGVTTGDTALTASGLATAGAAAVVAGDGLADAEPSPDTDDTDDADDADDTVGDAPNAAGEADADADAESTEPDEGASVEDAPASDGEETTGDAPVEEDLAESDDRAEQLDDAPLHAAVANLWDRPAAPAAEATEDAGSDQEASETEESTLEASDSDSAGESGGIATAGDADAESPDTEDTGSEDTDATRVLPLATDAVSLPLSEHSSTFTELITGIPASAAPAADEPSTPATEAITVFAPLMSNDDDDDDAVDDAEDNPQLAAMRTSLSSAASRFFDGPAPEYPYSRIPGDADQADTDQAADSDEAAPAADTSPEDDATPDTTGEQSEDGRPENHEDDHEPGDQHHG